MWRARFERALAFSLFYPTFCPNTQSSLPQSPSKAAERSALLFLFHRAFEGSYPPPLLSSWCSLANG
jgi:hypothetical protein